MSVCMHIHATPLYKMIFLINVAVVTATYSRHCSGVLWDGGLVVHGLLHACTTDRGKQAARICPGGKEGTLLRVRRRLSP